MKVLCENNIDFNLFRNLMDNLKKISNIATIGDISNIAKALNEFQPDLLLLKTESINGVVQAYANKNNVKVIGFADNENADVVADVVFPKSLDILKPNIDVIRFKEDMDKHDVSVFIHNPEQAFMADFLAKNYNVKVYGRCKINSPRYLGAYTDIEKYEIINKSKFIIDFGSYDLYDAILLDAYPIIYTNYNVVEEYKCFDNIVTLMECMEYIEDEDNASEINNRLLKLQDEFYKENSFTFAIDTLYKLGLEEQAKKLENTLEEAVA